MSEQNLYTLRDRVMTLPTLERRENALAGEIRKSEDEVSNLLRQYARESRDVEKLQQESFSAFLFRLVGKYENKLEKEQREEIAAKLAYDRASAHLEFLKREKDELASRISALRADKRAYQRELENRRQDLSGKLSQPNELRYAELEKERNTIIAQITEIGEAVRAAGRALYTANTIADSLDSAEGWATYDAFTRGGLISHMAKYSHIDEAEASFNILSHNLRELKSELADVQGLSVSGLTEISSGQRTLDFWFDNIFTDLSVRGQIQDNAEQINQLIRSINKAISALELKRSEMERALEQNRRSEEELLLSISK